MKAQINSPFCLFVFFVFFFKHNTSSVSGQCQVPAILNGTLLIGREGVWVDDSTVVNYECKNGLVLNDTAPVSCNNGTWTVIPRCVPGNNTHARARTHTHTHTQRERNVLFNDALNTFYLRLYGDRHG